MITDIFFCCTPATRDHVVRNLFASALPATDNRILSLASSRFWNRLSPICNPLIALQISVHYLRAQREY
jgi:hypothetical protein